MTKLSVVVVIIAVTVSVVASAEDKYTTKYDNIDLNEIITNKRLLKNYVNCLLGKATCTPDGQELKSLLHDALKYGCSKCNDKQRDGAKQIITHLFNKESELYKELEKMYDPTGEYKKKYEPDFKN